MDRAIISKQRRDGGRESNECGSPGAVPVTAVVEFGKHLLRAAARAKNPQRDHDGEQAANMQNQNQHLHEGQPFCQEGIEYDRKHGDGDHQ